MAGEIDTYEFNGGNSSLEIARDIALRGSSSDYKKGWGLEQPWWTISTEIVALEKHD